MCVFYCFLFEIAGQSKFTQNISISFFLGCQQREAEVARPLGLGLRLLAVLRRFRDGGGLQGGPGAEDDRHQ